MTTVRLNPDYIGEFDGTGIFRVDLGQSGFSSVSSISINDDNFVSGGTGSHSGLDLDFLKVLNTAIGDASTVASLTGEPVFDFSSNGVVFQPGFLTPLRPGDPAEWNTNLLGTSGANVYDPAKSSLGVLNGDLGALSLGEGGQVTLLLQSALSTSGRFFYYGETNSNDFSSYVLVSDASVTDVLPDSAAITLFGTSGNDTFRIGAGLNKHLASSDTTVYGQLGHDAIYGAFGDDTLVGGGGRDTLSGGAGNDWIVGGGSNDVLKGGSGKDAFVFDAKLSPRFNLDRILDFTAKDDTMYLENAIFTRSGKGSTESPTKLNPAAFWTGRAAHDSSDRIIYDKSTGAVYYDRDGTGAAEQVQFAQLSPGSKVLYHDFFVI